MTGWFQVALALVSWFLVAIAPAAERAYKDRAVLRSQRRGVSIVPVWPLMALLLLAPILVLGAKHVVATMIAVLHLLLLVTAAGYSAYWIVRLRRDAGHSR